MKQQADIFKALAHETRLAILHILEKQDMYVNDIVLLLEEKERTGVSKHLAVLKDLKLISVKGEGKKRLYHLESHCMLSAIKCTLDVINQKSNCNNLCK